MSNFNEATLSSYEKKVAEYIAGTPDIVDGNLASWLDRFAAIVPTDGSVFEVGSGTGRDALYLAEQYGLSITCSDAVESFVSLLQRENFKAMRFDVLNDNFPIGYSAVLGGAVFHHFTVIEFRSLMGKIFDFLPVGGVLGFTVKRGSGSEWSCEKLGAPRFFTYWEPEDVSAVLKSVGFQKNQIVSSEDWVLVVSVK